VRAVITFENISAKDAKAVMDMLVMDSKHMEFEPKHPSEHFFSDDLTDAEHPYFFSKNVMPNKDNEGCKEPLGQSFTGSDILPFRVECHL